MREEPDFLEDGEEEKEASVKDIEDEAKDEMEEEEEEEGLVIDPILAVKLEDAGKPTRSNRVRMGGYAFHWPSLPASSTRSKVAAHLLGLITAMPTDYPDVVKYGLLFKTVQGVVATNISDAKNQVGNFDVHAIVRRYLLTIFSAEDRACHFAGLSRVRRPNQMSVLDFNERMETLNTWGLFLPGASRPLNSKQMNVAFFNAQPQRWKDDFQAEKGRGAEQKASFLTLFAFMIKAETAAQISMADNSAPGKSARAKSSAKGLLGCSKSCSPAVFFLSCKRMF